MCLLNLSLIYTVSLLLIQSGHKNLFFIHYDSIKLATIVKGDLKVLFPIATTLMCKGGRYSFL